MDVDNNAPLPKVHEYEDTTSMHIIMFKGFSLTSNIIYEDVQMKVSVAFLDLLNNLGIRNWYDGLPPKKCPSLNHLNDAFNKEWGALCLRQCKTRGLRSYHN